MSLKGNLNSVDLANIFQMLSINQKEGTLNIFDGQSKKSIYFSRDGVSMLSRGKSNRDSLGRILLRYDKITEEQLERALEKQEASSQLLGTILEESGLVTREVIEDALRIQIEEEIYNLFIWKDASFEFIEGIPPAELDGIDGPLTRLTFNVNSLIMEAARRIDEWEHIRTLIPSMREIYRYTGRNMELTDDIFRKSYCEKILAEINGKSNVDEIIDRSYVNRFEVCKVLSLLREQEAVEPVPNDDLIETADAALDGGAVRDAIKFLERILETGGESPEINRKLGRAYEAADQLESARSVYRNYAEMAIRSGQVQEAYDTYRHLCEILPTDLQAAERLVEVFVNYGERVQGDADEVVERGRQLAAIYLELGKKEEAFQALQRVVSLAPRDFALRNQLINIYIASNMSTEAIAEYEAMADWYAQKRDWDQVIRILRKILLIDRSRDDVSHRLEQLQARRRKRKRGARRILVLSFLVLGLAGLTWAYIDYELAARQEIAKAEGAASRMLSNLSDEIEPVHKKLSGLLAAGPTEGPELEGLAAQYRKAEPLLSRYEKQLDAIILRFEKVADNYRYTTARNEAVRKQAELRLTLRSFRQTVGTARVELQRRARGLVSRARGDLEHGEYREALELLETARHCAPDPSALKKHNVDEIITQLRKDLGLIESRLGSMNECLEKGRYAEARSTVLGLLSEFFVPEVLTRVRVPVHIESRPPGAEISLDGKSTGVRTPGWVTYSPTRGTLVSLKLAGFATAVERIPATDLDKREQGILLIKSHQMIRKELRKELTHRVTLTGSILADPRVIGDWVYYATRASRVYRVNPKARRVEEIYDAARISLSGFDASPAARGTSLFVATVEGRVEKLDLARILSQRLDRRTPAWSRDLPGMVHGSLAMTDHCLLVGDDAGYLHALDPETGKTVWMRRLVGQIKNRPVESGGRVFVTTASGWIYVLDPVTGEPERPAFAPEGAARPLLSAPAVRKDLLYVGASDGGLYAFDTKTGKQVWRVDAGAEISAAPVLLGDVVIAVTLDGRVHAVRDGRLLDTIKVGGAIRASPVVVGDRIFLAGDRGEVLRIEMAEGRFHVQWRYQLEGTDKPDRKGPAVSAGVAAAGERILVATESGRVFIMEQ